MRAFRIDHGGINEIDEDLAAILTKDTTWDCVSLSNGHDVWVDDEGLLAGRVLTAVIDDVHRVPLPAYILAADGERSAAATLTLDEVRMLVRIDRRRARDWGHIFDRPDLPAIGFDFVVGTDGWPQPWRAVLAFDDDVNAPIEFLMRLPESEYVGPTMHPVHGDLTKLPLTAVEQAEAVCLAMRLRGHDVLIGNWRCLDGAFDERLGELGVDVKAVVLAEPDGPTIDDTRGIGGRAGHEVSHVFDNELAERRLVEWGERQRVLKAVEAQSVVTPENQAA